MERRQTVSAAPSSLQPVMIFGNSVIAFHIPRYFNTEIFRMQEELTAFSKRIVFELSVNPLAKLEKAGIIGFSTLEERVLKQQRKCLYGKERISGGE